MASKTAEGVPEQWHPRRAPYGPVYWVGLIIFGTSFIVAGSLHFLFPAPYLRIMPPAFPDPKLLVSISGLAEIAGGVGLFIPKLRRAAAYGLVLLLVAVFPANVYMAVAHVSFPGIAGEPWAQWLRLPLQIPIHRLGMALHEPLRG